MASAQQRTVTRLAAAVAKDHPWGFSVQRRERIAEEVLSAAYPVIVADIVEWLRGRTGAHGGGFTCADDVAYAIDREFGNG